MGPGDEGLGGESGVKIRAVYEYAPRSEGKIRGGENRTFTREFLPSSRVITPPKNASRGFPIRSPVQEMNQAGMVRPNVAALVINEPALAKLDHHARDNLAG